MSLFLPKWGFITVFMIGACHWTMSQIHPYPYQRMYPNLKPFVTCLWWGAVSPLCNPTFLWPSIRHPPCTLRMCHAVVTKNLLKSFTSLPFVSISKHICKVKSNYVLVSSWTSVCMVQHDSHLTDFVKFFIWDFYDNLSSHSDFASNHTKITDTLCADLYTFLIIPCHS